MTTLVILLGSLVPLISQAGYQLSGDAAWLEICTANGIDRVAVDAGPESSGERNAASGSCAWCTLHAGFACVPSRDIVFPAFDRDPTGPSQTVRTPHRPLPGWPAALPRAPPLA